MFRVLSVQSSFLWTLSCKFNHFGLSSLTAPSPELRESTNSICLFLSQPVNLLMAISRDNRKVCMVQGSLTFLPDAQCFENCYFILIVCFILSCFFFRWVYQDIFRYILSLLLYHGQKQKYSK